MPKSVTVHATKRTRSQWICNQCVSVSHKIADSLVVTSGQNRSTPGIYTKLYLKQNTNYQLTLEGCSYQTACAFMWIYDPRTKLRLIENYTFLPNSKRGTVSACFCSPSSANEYVTLYAGVLFTKPCTGQQFELCRLTIECAAKYKSCYKDSHSDCDSSDHTTSSNCTDEHGSSNSDDGSNDSDSDYEVHHHHHHHQLRPNVPSHTHDPYYNYNSYPSRKESDEYERHSKPEPYHPHPPSHPPPPPPHRTPMPTQNCRIDDLQQNLSTMIQKMKR
jgi:hypothetical protein